MRMEKIALIPAYEPDERFLNLLKTLKAFEIQTVVVDDGSGPAFAPVFRKAGSMATVLRHAKNRGKGSALKTGFAEILDRFGERCIVVTMECDGQHTVKDALRICGEAERHKGSLILGSRELKAGTPKRSQFGNTATRLVYALATGQKIHDTQTGLRAFDGSLLPWLLSVTGERYEYEMNVLLECPRQKIPIVEVKIETIYLNQNAGSHFDTIRDSVRVYREILRFSASSLVSFIIDYVLYSVLLLLSGNLTVSNVGARLVSASVNYTLNRRVVFQNDSGLLRSALQYALLAMVILAGNTVCLHVLAERLGVNRWAAKLLTELLFFVLSWTVQRSVIFRKKDGRSGPERKEEAK